MALDELLVFRNFIRRKSLRYTPEREQIVKEVFSTHDHFDVDDLYLRMRNKGKNVSKASIYRTIPLLLESGLIQEVFHEDGHMHYEHIYGHPHHCHLRCISCGKIIEFRNESIMGLEKELEKQYGFEVIGHKLDVYGRCTKCRHESGSG